MCMRLNSPRSCMSPKYDNEVGLQHIYHIFTCRYSIQKHNLPPSDPDKFHMQICSLKLEGQTLQPTSVHDHALIFRQFLIFAEDWQDEESGDAEENMDLTYI